MQWSEYKCNVKIIYDRNVLLIVIDKSFMLTMLLITNIHRSYRYNNCRFRAVAIAPEKTLDGLFLFLFLIFK